MLLEMLLWWYGAGWAGAAKSITARTADTAKFYSVTTLLKTLFAPWKRIQTTGKSFDDKTRALVDNMISRLVGASVRIIVLFAALIMIGGNFIFGAVVAIVWPFIPLAVILSVIKGIIG